jgi:meso-butanediol dehydrogenase/(S,S)-butanediol dehydrogenase/diacetyl reductase
VNQLPRRFDGKVALVTGAASGIGRATCERLASEGASLVCADVQAEALQATVKSCQERGARVEHGLCDVSDPEQVRATVRLAIDRFGRLDVLCNIAGILLMEHAHATRLEDWRRVLEVNLTGTFLMSVAALPHLLESKGNIVNASSTSALAGLPYGAAYGASKGGVLALTRTFAVEYGKQGLRANAVCPGSIQTPMTTRNKLPENPDMKLIMRAAALDRPRGPETVAGVIAMLASEDGAHINGEHIRVDGGTLS